MSLELCNLGSGSSGNSSLVRVGGCVFLIDAGFGPRAIIKRLSGTGVDVDNIKHFLLTHLDRDHFTPTWFKTLLEKKIHIHAHQQHRHRFYQVIKNYSPIADARLLHQAGLLHWFDDAPFELQLDSLQRIVIKPIHLTHDADGTTGFHICTRTTSMGYATDLGRVPDALISHFTDVDILAIESNYDPAMQLASDRPAMLKHRVMGGHGHLSNEESFDAVSAIFKRSDTLPRHVVLLHLSRQCNDPVLVRDTFSQHREIVERLCITQQSQRTKWLQLHQQTSNQPDEQLQMFTQ